MHDNLKIAVIGGGSWATALVKILCNNQEKICWWMRNSENATYIGKYHHNPNYLSPVEFDIKKLCLGADISHIVKESDILVMAVPAAFLKE